MNWTSYPVPEILPPTIDDLTPETSPHTGETPSILDMGAFFTLAGILLIATQAIGVAIILHWHMFGHISFRKLAYQPQFTIPMMIVSYGVVLWAAALLFNRAWPDGFLAGIHWNIFRARQYALRLAMLGIGLGLGIQLISNYLPVPTKLPIDAYFQNSLDAWLVAVFGVLVAPIVEEIAFRGFLYPSLRPWTGRILAAILASIPFALLHAQQVGHAWAPLALVFFVSLVLVAVRERTGSVAASALVHACYNLSIFGVIFFASGGFQHLERLKN